MKYEKNISVPANTPIDGPEEEEITLEQPVITHAEIMFPPGPEGLAHGAIFYGTDRRFPSPRGDWITGNNETVGGTVFFESGEEEPTVTLRAYNEDDTYPHTLYFRIDTLSKMQAYWRKSIAKLAEAIDKLFKWTGGR